MSNMSYCRFHNTYHDLVDCKNALYNEDISSDEEKRYAKPLNYDNQSNSQYILLLPELLEYNY